MGPNPTDDPNPVLEHRWQITIPKANTPLRHSVCEREKFCFISNRYYPLCYGYSPHACIWNHIMSHHGTCSNYYSISNGYTFTNYATAPNPNVIFYMDRPFIFRLGIETMVITIKNAAIPRNHTIITYRNFLSNMNLSSIPQ